MLRDSSKWQVLEPDMGPSRLLQLNRFHALTHYTPTTT